MFQWNFHNRRSSESQPMVNTLPQPRPKGGTNPTSPQVDDLRL
jgi:hypothetical protein